MLFPAYGLRKKCYLFCHRSKFKISDFELHPKNLKKIKYRYITKHAVISTRRHKFHDFIFFS